MKRPWSLAVFLGGVRMGVGQARKDTDQSGQRDNCLETHTVHLLPRGKNNDAQCLHLQNGAIGRMSFVQCRELSWPISPISTLHANGLTSIIRINI